jgi:two-component sensor histidine kinase
MILWWGPRVLPAIYLNALVVARLWPAPWEWTPLLALPQVVEPLLAWLLFQKLARGKCWLPNLNNLLLYLGAAVAVPSVICVTYTALQLIWLDSNKLDDFGINFWIYLTTDLSGHVTVGVPTIAFLTPLLAKRNWLGPVATPSHPQPLKLIPDSRRHPTVKPVIAVTWLAILILSVTVKPINAWLAYGLINLAVALAFGAPLSMLTTSWTLIAAVVLPLVVTGGDNMEQIELDTTLQINTAILFLVAAIMGAARTVSDLFDAVRLAEQQRRRERFMRNELDHRVKNNLASMVGLVDQTLETTDSLQQFGAAFRGRIHAITEAHQLITTSQFNSLDFQSLIQTMLAPHVNGNAERIQLQGDPIELPPKLMTPLSMILHELATNAAKHGALANHHGQLHIDWLHADHHTLQINWRESNTQPTPPAHNPTGSGIDLIQGFVEFELRGKIQHNLTPQGLDCQIQIPIPVEHTPAT